MNLLHEIETGKRRDVDVVTFLETLDPDSKLNDYTHTILCFVHWSNGRYKLGQPDYIRLNGEEELGPSNIESWLEADNKRVTFDKTVKQALEILK